MLWGFMITLPEKGVKAEGTPDTLMSTAQRQAGEASNPDQLQSWKSLAWIYPLG